MISIALCTYNGESYLREQLDSIVAQTLPPDELVVCDDGSHDRTPQILKEFCKSAPFPVDIHLNKQNLGLQANFSKAIELCQNDWISLCDQDDCWLPDKLERLSQKMDQLKMAYGKETPLLVHSDAIVTDSNLRTIADSLWQFQYTNPEKGHTLNRLLSQNVVTGCTAMFNRALWLKARPIPDEAMMHDWWLALVASVFGTIGLVQEPTILYRQHGDNDTGAKRWISMFSLAALRDLSKISVKTNNQARAFLDRYGGELSELQNNSLRAFIDMPQRSYFTRKYLTIHYGLHYHGLLRNIGSLIFK